MFQSYTGVTSLPEYIRQNPRGNVLSPCVLFAKYFTAGTFALAWIMTKFTEPVRLGVSVAVVPSVARAVGRVPPKSNDPTDGAP